MSLTYLDIVNAVLRDTNEVPLTPSNFDKARGFHAFLKEAANRSLMDIANESQEWSWLANKPMDMRISSHSTEVTTDRRKAIYEFPDEAETVDWDSIVMTDMRGRESYPLTPISYEEWARYGHADVVSYRTDEDIGRPTVIYKTKDNKGFGLSPVPDKQYRVQFITWKAPAFMTNSFDSIMIPDRYFNVLVNRLRYYAWMFRENSTQANMANRDYSDGLNMMKRDLIKPIFMRMRAV